jgi:hypothetical protein
MRVPATHREGPPPVDSDEKQARAGLGGEVFGVDRENLRRRSGLTVTAFAALAIGASDSIKIVKSQNVARKMNFLPNRA